MRSKYEVLNGEHSESWIRRQYRFLPKSSKHRTCCLLLILTAAAVLLLAISLVVIVCISLNKYLQHSGTGVVVSDVKSCSEMGREVLVEKGGNAVDAAFVTILCMGLYSPQYNGVGGGGFMVVFQDSTRMETIDFREVAPLAAFENMFESENSSSTRGGLSVAVPGEMRGLEMSHNRYGRLSWEELFVPVIAAAENGFIVSSYLAETINKYSSLLSNNSIYWTEFTNNGKPLQAGELMKRPSLARTLRKLQTEGADAFYTGDIAAEIVNYTREHGGVLEMEDLRSYEALVKPVISTNYKGFTLISAPLPSGGPTVLYCMNILNRQAFNSTPTGWDYQRIIEAFKFSFAERFSFGDPGFINDSNLTEIVDELMLEETGEQIYKRIDDKTYEPSHYGDIKLAADNHGTTHISILDQYGMAVAVTISVNLHFGSGLITPTYGIVLNDDMDDFSSPNISNAFNLPPSPHNFIRPGKRAQSSMAPVIVLDKYGVWGQYRVHAISGASGGSRITTSVVQVLLDMLSFGMSPEEAVSTKRIHDQLVPQVLYLENGFPENAEAILRRVYEGVDNVTNGTEAHSAADAVLSWLGEVSAASDPRKGGGPAFTDR